MLISVSDISLSFGVRTLLSGVSFTAAAGDRLGVVGVNGAGKTTLFRMITGEMQPDTGDIRFAREARVGILRQDAGLFAGKTLWETAMDTFSDRQDMETQMRTLEHEISACTDLSEQEVLLRRYDRLSHAFHHAGGYDYNSRAKGVLKGLGFGEDEFDRLTDTLSGGQKTRLALACLLLETPDILMLDEPTNHLDISAVEWLEDFLSDYRGCLMVISHDRFFLDRVTNKTLDVENGKVQLYDASYSGFVERKRALQEAMEHAYNEQQREIARQRAIIEQFRRWNREKSIRKAESREKMLDKMEKVEKPPETPESVRIRFGHLMESGYEVMNIENLAKSYPGKPLFSEVNLKLERGERFFILGPNGSGKSTLLKILAGRLAPDTGRASFGVRVKHGYYDQEHAAFSENSTILQEAWSVRPDLPLTSVRSLLAAFLFRGEEVEKEVRLLSGGEKGRLALCRLILQGSNTLLLDEPTNHLDIASREALEDALTDYPGTVICVSHDRYFIDRLATRIIEIQDGQVMEYRGDYAAFRKYVAGLELARQQAQNAAAPSEGKAAYTATKEERANRRRMEKQLETTEKDIARTEARVAALQKDMADPSNASNYEALIAWQAELDASETRLLELYDLWEELSSTVS